MPPSTNNIIAQAYMWYKEKDIYDVKGCTDRDSNSNALLVYSHFREKIFIQLFISSLLIME
jgi:hypothetical protein